MRVVATGVGSSSSPEGPAGPSPPSQPRTKRHSDRDSHSSDAVDAVKKSMRHCPFPSAVHFVRNGPLFVEHGEPTARLWPTTRPNPPFLGPTEWNLPEGSEVMRRTAGQEGDRVGVGHTSKMRRSAPIGASRSTSNSQRHAPGQDRATAGPCPSASRARSSRAVGRRSHDRSRAND